MTEEERCKLQAGEQFKVSDESVERHNDHIIECINKVVRPEDTLYHLGDFIYFFAKKNFQAEYQKRFDEITSRINCKDLVFVRGNHDPYREVSRLNKNHCNPISDVDIVYFSKYDFNDVLTISDTCGKFFLSHYAHAVWPGMSKQVMHLYGHSHSSAEETLDKAFPHRRSIDVGIDNLKKIWNSYQPVSLAQIAEYMRGFNGCKIDHHGEGSE